MKKRTVFYRGLTALVIIAMLVTVPAVSNVAYADAVNVEDAAEQQTEAANEDGTGEPETEASTEPETETAEEDGTKEPETKAPTEPETEAPKAEDNKEPETETPKEQKTETPKEQDSEDAAAEFEANIAKLKAYEEKLEDLTDEEADTVLELYNAVSAYLNDNEGVELSDETKALLGKIEEMVNSATSIETVGTTSTETKSIKEQIEAGETAITVSKDTTEDVVISSGKNITLTIADGVTLTNDDDHTVTVQDGGTLTIEGKGTIDNITHGKAALKVEEGGTATIKSGTFTRSQEAGTSKTDSGGNSFYYIQNHGTLTIEYAEVSSEGCFSSLIQNGYYNWATENKEGNYKPKLTIKGGTFSGGINTIKNDDDGIVEISGGEFSNTTQYALMNCNVAKISGGTFSVAEDSKYDAVWNRYAGSTEHDAGSMVITGGTFKDSIWSNANSELDIQNIDAVGKLFIDKGAKLSITAKPEKESDGKYSYTFLGWFDKNGALYADSDEALSEANEYTPNYLSSKIESTDSSADTAESEDTTTSTLDDNAKEVISSILGGEVESGDSKVKYEALTENVANALKAALADENASIVTKLELEAVPEVPEIVLSEFSKVAEEKTASASSTENSWTVAPDCFVNIDINMYIAQGENNEEKVARITEVNREVDLSIAIPEELRSKNNKYAVVRYHGDKAEILDATKSTDGNSVIFRSNLFSYYGLIYQEVKNADNSSTASRSSGNRSIETTASTGTSNGTWIQDATGWWFKKADGSYPKDTWYECVWNGVSNWYHFNAQGYADGGWLTDKDGQKYYLHNAHDGKFGFMYTGWNKIADQWYYFNTSNIATGIGAGSHSKGSLVTNGTTADGYKVGADGAWIQ